MGDIESFIESLDALNPHDRRVKVKLYLSSSIQSSYYVPIRMRKVDFLKLATRNSATPKCNIYRYVILTVLLNEIRRDNGSINKKVRLQLASDFTKGDLEEIGYHLYKPPLDIDNIRQLIKLYEERYFDVYFSQSLDHFTYTKNQIAIIATNQTVSTFFYISEGGEIKSCVIGNVLHQHKLRESLKLKIFKNFVVATTINIKSVFKQLGVNINKMENKKCIKSIKFINTRVGNCDIYTNIMDGFIIECN